MLIRAAISTMSECRHFVTVSSTRTFHVDVMHLMLYEVQVSTTIYGEAADPQREEKRREESDCKVRFSLLKESRIKRARTHTHTHTQIHTRTRTLKTTPRRSIQPNYFYILTVFALVRYNPYCSYSKTKPDTFPS